MSVGAIPTFTLPGSLGRKLLGSSKASSEQASPPLAVHGTGTYNLRTVEQLDGCGEKKNDKLCIEAMGSYRRGEETSGDLDILITRDISQGNRRSSKCIHVSSQ
jgi:hypothetical protein